jgi:predicted transporter
VFAFTSPLLVLVLVFAGLETYRRWQRRRQGGEQSRAYYSVAPLARVLVAVVYLSLIALLVVGMDATNLPRTLG